MRTKQLYARAIEKWGPSSQLGMAVEEMSELTTKIQHLLRGRIQATDLAEEVADVEIMMGQLRVLLNADRLIDDEKDRKLLRLKDRLDTN